MPYTSQLGLPYASGSDTSHAAAVRMERHVGAQGRMVLSLIRRRGSATQKEVAAMLDLGRPSCCARFRELELAGKIAKTKFRRGHCAVYTALGEW